jgi:hypothetical protein
MRNALSWFASPILFIALVACATGTGTGGDDDTVDAAANTDAHKFPDAGPTPDAFEFPDAAPIPDATLPGGPDSGLFCSGEADCPAADDCCFYVLSPPGFCVVGAVQLGVCLPAQ